MVLLNGYSASLIELQPAYYLQNIHGSISSVYCRKEVAERLLKAANELPVGYRFMIWDAWRPVSVQAALFEAFKKALNSRTGLDAAELDKLVQTYVSLPSTDEKKPSPHLTGGAIDLTIINDHGEELDMGTGFDHFGEEACTNYYERRALLSQNEKLIRQNRRLLYNLLTSFGFTNYPHEWWHFDYGNQFWGIQTQKVAIYNKVLSPM